MRFERHLFVCINDRGIGHPKGCCASKGGAEIAQAIKLRAYEKGLKGVVRVNKAGCLDACAEGVAAVVYPDGTWYRNLTLADVDELVDQHLIGGRPVQRLLADDSPRAPKTAS